MSFEAQKSKFSSVQEGKERFLTPEEIEVARMDIEAAKETETRERGELEKIRSSLENTKQQLEELRAKIDAAQDIIHSLSSMEAGSPEKYLAAYQMLHDVEEMFPEYVKSHPAIYADPFVDSEGYYNSGLTSLEYAERKIDAISSPSLVEESMALKQEIEETRTPANEVASDIHNIIRAMMSEWYSARSEYESREGTNEKSEGSGEMASLWKELGAQEITLEKAKRMMTSPKLSSGLQAEIGYELIKRFIGEQDFTTAVGLALQAEKQRLYNDINNAGLFNLTAALSRRYSEGKLADERLVPIIKAPNRWYSEMMKRA